MWHLISLSCSVFLLDQITKWVVRSTMLEGETISVYGNLFNLTYVKNEGMAFGLFQNHGQFLVLITIFVIMGILASFKYIQGLWSKTAVGLVLGGAAANLFDRLRFGGVIDFLDVGLASFRWPVFNLADSFICLGVGMVVYHWIKKG